MLHLARLLIDSGNWSQSEFSALFSDRTPPPTSKKFLEDLKDHLVRDEDEGQCPICLKSLEQDDILNELPCKHKFHKECIIPWLKKVMLLYTSSLFYKQRMMQETSLDILSFFQFFENFC